MQFLGNVLQQVPLFGTWFNALSGLSREAVIGIGSAAETLFRVMLKCVTGNLLDAFFMAIVAELLRGAFHPRSMRGSVLLFWSSLPPHSAPCFCICCTRSPLKI